MAFHNSRTEIKALMEAHGFHLSKGLGQNLLTDGNIIRKIVEAAEISADDVVVEIGPGIGALTSELCKNAKKVISVEIDKRIIPLLQEVTKDYENLEIVNCDIMDFNISDIGENYKIVGNLPYYITSPIIMKLLEESRKPDVMVLMIQKEVAKRISASSGSKVYGAISVACQYRCLVEYLFDVSCEVFLPKPKVDSAVIKLAPYVKDKASKAKNEKTFYSIVKAGFGQRRKMLRNSLLNADIGKEIIDTAFEQANIKTTQRAESLSIEEFISLADAIDALQK